MKEAPGKANRPADAPDDQCQENQAPDPNHNGLDGVSEDDVKKVHVNFSACRSRSGSRHTGWNSRRWCEDRVFPFAGLLRSRGSAFREQRVRLQ